MKTILTLIFSCLLSFAFGETIGNVEYELPPQIIQNWEIVNKIENTKGITMIYAPKGIQSFEEFFAVGAYKVSQDLNDLEPLKEYLGQMFTHVELLNIQRDEHSVLYGWAASDNHREVVHGLGRIFSSPEGIVMLQYQRESSSNLEEVENLWLPILKNAVIN